MGKQPHSNVAQERQSPDWRPANPTLKQIESNPWKFSRPEVLLVRLARDDDSKLLESLLQETKQAIFVEINGAVVNKAPHCGCQLRKMWELVSRKA